MMEKLIRRPRTATRKAPVREYFFDEEKPLPCVIEASDQDVNLAQWLRQNAETTERKLLRYGAVLFRNFGVTNIREFEEVSRSLGEELLNYDFASTPRTALKEKVYTSTEYPADQEIIMHNEMAYSKKWPEKLWFYCHQPPTAGGETPLVDSRRLYGRIGAETKEAFEKHGLLYVRNYHENLDLAWEEVFQTTSRDEVEHYCQEHGIDYQWIDNHHLQTRERCPAVLSHPATQEKSWFNQAHLFHVSNLADEIKNTLLTLLDEAMVPRNVYLGNGAPIEGEALDAIRALYSEEKVVFSWQKNDVLLVDNILVAHGRHPYRGDRKIVVAMTH